MYPIIMRGRGQTLLSFWKTELNLGKNFLCYSNFQNWSCLYLLIPVDTVFLTWLLRSIWWEGRLSWSNSCWLSWTKGWIRAEDKKCDKKCVKQNRERRVWASGEQSQNSNKVCPRPLLMIGYTVILKITCFFTMFCSSLDKVQLSFSWGF